MPLKTRLLPLMSAFAGRALSAAGILLLAVVVSRVTDADNAGQFFVVQTVAAIAALSARFGLDMHLMKAVSAQPLDSDKSPLVAFFGYSRWPFVFCALLTAGGASVQLLLLLAESPYASLPVLFFWIPVIPLCMTNMNAAYYKGKHRPALGGLMEGGFFSFPAIAVILLDQGHYFSENYSIWFLYSFGCWAIYIVGVAGLLRSNKNWAADYQSSRSYLNLKLLLNAKFIAFNQFVAYASQWVGVLLLGAFESSRDAGMLAVLLRLAIPLQFTKLTLDYFFAPYFSRVFGSGDARALRTLLWQSAVAGIAIGSPIFLAMFFYPAPLVEFLFGPEYVSGANIISIISAILFLNLAAGSSGTLLNMANMDIYVFYSTLVNASVSIILYVTITIQYGLVGGAIASVAPVAVKSFYQLYIVRSRLLRGKKSGL